MVGRAMVTGAAGRIGRAVLALLAERGIEANALVLDDPGDLAARLVVTGDAADAKTVRAALEGADAVIHLAAIPTPARNTAFEVFAGNSLSTFTVLEEAGRAGIRHAAVASSWGVTGLPWTHAEDPHPPYAPVDEAMASQVADPYGLSKQVDELTAQMMARRHGMSVVCLRYPYVGGFEERLYAHAARLTADPAAGARDLWTYLEVHDAARAALLALDVPGRAAHAVHLCAPEIIVPYPTEELLRRYHPTAVLRHPLPGRTAPVDTSAARRLLGFTAQNLLGHGAVPPS
ncbi:MULTISPECIES: NAD-dependent epimerase/dehydratase family protein [unclassified Streptomyces]|uniref:NAD-dependent epimerase/dehydratase family protein n=1 Tax=unclassified Streptomyces TaxID=2593676 RepID=UPI002DD7FA79|nr:NAD(P)-dependent oxidoreductase [Streptomyces sp. NBC_01237]WRZ77477.1 NAD(P)-dependent oxidoreductase [Streptomyces sp. NBC_01237]